MMHGREKSDLVVVAAKPANKAEQSAAELVEPRTGTKGNAGQQSTRRAQDRVSVSQALSRVRKAAKQRKKESSRRSSTISMPPCYAQPSLL
jgi:RNA-directed DNA polymerase